MFCPKCGNQFEDTAAFCDKCGTKLNDTQQAIPKIPSGNIQAQVIQETSKINGKFKIWMIPPIAVVVVVVFIIIIMPMLNSKTKLSVNEVKSSYLEAEWGYDIPEFEQITIGEAFEGYFENTINNLRK